MLPFVLKLYKKIVIKLDIEMIGNKSKKYICIDCRINMQCKKTERHRLVKKREKIAMEQHHQCANKPQSKILGLKGIKCPLWKIIEDDIGNFGVDNFELYDKKRAIVSSDGKISDLCAICLHCADAKIAKLALDAKMEKIKKKKSDIK